MWVLSTVHWILDVIRAKAAFIDTQPLPDGTLGYYLDLSNPLQAAKTAVYVTLTLVGNGFMIYRCYIVWDSWYMALPPAVMLCGTAVAGYGAAYKFSRVASGAQVFVPAIVPWVTSFFALAFSANIICAALVVIRILSIQRSVGRISGSPSRINLSLKAIFIVTESAALYSASVLSLLVLYTLNSNGQYPALDLTSPLIGIVFTLIILRVTLVSDSEQVYPSAQGSTRPDPSRMVAGAGSEHYGMQLRATAMSVNVTRFMDGDSFNCKVSSNTMA
ncbi:hypothetical protein PQX77_003623 [Marasmius sp. AFHP31]|nr:hypothetical protein PQX77_003623 [Marasmius sp. AFHP31]